jgi:AcrR family transcriptional regulator
VKPPKAKSTQTVPRPSGRPVALTAYHHGDLRAALLTAAEAELKASGIEKFSLRGVAKRAGVSHAAPAHHFGDVDGLLTALAAIGFERFLASGLGYIDFAMANPELFQLMFSSQRTDFDDAKLCTAANAAFDALVDDVRQHRGKDPHAHAPSMLDVMALWSLAHGAANLINSGRLPELRDLPQAKRDAALIDIIGRGAPD